MLNAASHATLQMLKKLGVLCHPGKCELEPASQLDFLGMRLNVPNKTFHLTSK